MNFEDKLYLRYYNQLWYGNVAVYYLEEVELCAAAQSSQWVRPILGELFKICERQDVFPCHDERYESSGIAKGGDDGRQVDNQHENPARHESAGGVVACTINKYQGSPEDVCN